MAETPEETMDHGQQRRAIEGVSRLDGTMNRHFGPEALRLVETEERLFPLGAVSVPNIGAVLILGKSPNGNSPVDLHQPFGCAVLLRDATPEEIAKEWSPTQRPTYIERLKFDWALKCFVPTGKSEGYVPF